MVQRWRRDMGSPVESSDLVRSGSSQSRSQRTRQRELSRAEYHRRRRDRRSELVFAVVFVCGMLASVAYMVWRSPLARVLHLPVY